MDAQAAQYRDVIDRLVRSSLEGQGDIGPRRVRAGIWHSTGSGGPDPEALFAKLDRDEREVVAGILLEMFVSGVLETLVVLRQADVTPFDKAYDTSPQRDFVNRLDGSAWPTDRERS